MTVLPQTERALTELAANSNFGPGQHVAGMPRAGVDGLVIGASPYDPTRHDPSDIDPLSVMGLSTGEEYVRHVLPSKPLELNVVVDHTDRNEYPALLRIKDNLGLELANTIDDTVPGATDRVYGYMLSDGSRPVNIREMEVIDVRKRGRTRSVAELAYDGLTFVLSDFNRWDFDVQSKDRLHGLIAVKINHPAERSLPAGVGRISLGGWAEVDTNSDKQLTAANSRLQQRHELIVDQLQANGAQVVDVVIDPENPLGYDAQAVDKALAIAVRHSAQA